MTDRKKLDAIRAEIHRLVDVRGYDRGMAIDLFAYIDSLQEEPVSNDLEEAAWLYYDKNRRPISPEWDLHKEFIDFFKAGAQWQKENLWKPADGEDLPEIDREVIALVEENEHYKAVFAHRPPEYWDGKNILTDEVTRYEPKRYDKGGWNMPNIKYWLDLKLPKMAGGEV